MQEEYLVNKLELNFQASNQSLYNNQNEPKWYIYGIL